MRALGWIAVLVSLVACHHDDARPPRGAPVPAAAAEVVSSAKIDQLARSCEAKDLAALIVIASAPPKAAPAAGSGSPADLEPRCRAMRELLRRYPIPNKGCIGVVHSRVAVLDVPAVRDALAAMLADDRSSCEVADGSFVAPDRVASELIVDFPIQSLRPQLERAAAHDRETGHDSGARVALHMLDLDLEYQATPRAQKIDELVAAGTPEAFERLLDFLAKGMPWDDGLPPPSAAERAEIKQHVSDALLWLHLLARIPRPEDWDWHWDCATDIRAALATGKLGRDIRALFKKFEPPVREALLDILALAPPPDFDAWVVGVARKDPDPDVRASALVLGPLPVPEVPRRKVRAKAPDPHR